MNRILFLLLLLWSLPTMTAGETPGNDPLILTGETDRFSYAIGLEIAQSLQPIVKNTDLNIDILTRAIVDMVNGNTLLLDEKTAETVKKTVFSRIQSQVQNDRNKQAKKNAAEEQAFLADNKEKKGIVTTTSGLQYKVIKKGKGKIPTSSDKVTVHYRGTLLDGTVFDSSYDRGEPATFGVNQVIKGWSEALQLMPVGSKYTLYIPAKLGYGSRGAGEKIGPNACLVFTVELLEIGSGK